ncbi:MAG TPA: hypothetical protein VMY39_04100 [Planctomycetota bacterium]|nr:hypothetical protein [Planctomycetota bacterium]
MADFCCDMCGKPLLVDSDVRYVARIEVFAAYDPMELTADDLARDHLKEIRELVQRLAARDPQALEDEVYKQFTFDLCPTCQKRYLKQPLPKPQQEEP